MTEYGQGNHRFRSTKVLDKTERNLECVEDDDYSCSRDCSCFNNSSPISFPRNSGQPEFVSGERSYTMMMRT